MSEVLFSLTHAVPAGFMLAEIALGALVVLAARRRQRADFLGRCMDATMEVGGALDQWLSRRRVSLSKGLFAIVDAADYAQVSRHKWCAHTVRGGRHYAVRHDPQKRGRNIYMHRELLGAAPGAEVDHRNCNGLDNRRGNLRAATSSTNHANSRRRANNTTGWKGVIFNPRWGTWHAQLSVAGRGFYLGSFKSPEEAATSYGLHALAAFGEFARLE